MLTRSVVVKVIVFAVVGIIAVVYTGMRYAGIGSSLLNPGYTVHLELAEGGGIVPNSEVTYRGVPVGTVTDMRLTDSGVEAELRISSAYVHIPTNLQASVADRSAVGEQYVDLTPNTISGPYLRDGSAIPVQQTTIPLPTQNLLTDVDKLAGSVPIQSLQTTVDELDTAFAGSGASLQKLLDSAAGFIAAAQQQLPETIQLLNSGQTVLDTQNTEAGAIESFSGSLNELSAQLKSSDPELRQLIANAPLAATQLTDLLVESGPQLGSVLANLLTTTRILVTRESGLQEALVAYPLVAAAANTVVPGDGTAHLGLAINLFDPPPCVRGYQGTQLRPGNDVSPATLNTQAYCAEPAGSPTDVRGAENAPYGGAPGSAVGETNQQGATAQPGASAPASGLGSNTSGIGLTSLAQLLGLPG